MEEGNIDFQKFKSLVENGGGTRVWHVTDKNGYAGLCKMGFDREYIGKNSKVYGDGVYTTFTLKSTLENKRGGTYGGIILECVLLGGFKDFLFFDKRMNEKFNGGEPLVDQFKRLLPKQLFDKIMNSGRLRSITEQPPYHSDSYLHGKLYRTGPLCMNFVDVVAPKINGNSNKRDERMLARSSVRGYIFQGFQDGDVAVIRDFKAIIPVRSSTDGVNWRNILTEDEFNNITTAFDAGHSLIGRYTKTNPNEKLICGMVRVRNEEGKYNYYDKENDTELLPIWVDEAFPFDTTSKMGLFIHDGKKYKVSKDYIVDLENNERLPINGFDKYIEWNKNQPVEPLGNQEIMGGFDDLFESIWKDVLFESAFDEIAELPWDEFKTKFDAEKIGKRDWKNEHKDRFVHLWHCTKASNIKDIKNIGLDVIYRGGEALGKGAYCSFSLDSARDNRRTYGGSIVEFILNGGLNDFLFFDRRMNDIYNNGEPLERQYKRLLPQDMYDFIMNNEKIRRSVTSFDQNSCQNFINVMRDWGNKYISTRAGNGWRRDSDNSEFALSKTKVKGWVVDYWCGKSVIVRNYKDLIPVAVSSDGYDFTEILSQESYESIGSQEDIGVRFRGKYPMTDDNEKIQCGFLRVRRSDGKYNYVDVKTMDELLPKNKWADTALPFDQTQNTAIFTVNGRKYKTNGKAFFDLESGESIDPSELGSEHRRETGSMMGGFDDLFERMEKIRIADANHNRIVI